MIQVDYFVILNTEMFWIELFVLWYIFGIEGCVMEVYSKRFDLRPFDIMPVEN